MSQFSLSPLIVLLTDFGLSDGYVGVMKGVIAQIAPQTHIIDLTHEIEPQQVGSAAWVLASSYRYFPPETIFVCVIDPEVGSSRHPIAFSAGSWRFVGPDNGLFSYILAEQPLHELVALTNPAYHLERISSTFHGRDLFSPVAAYLSLGTPLSSLGEALIGEKLQRLPGLFPERLSDGIQGRIIHIDHFGNLVTSLPLSLLPDFLTAPNLSLSIPRRNLFIRQRRRFFADEAGNTLSSEPFLYPDSSGYLAIALRNGNARRALNIELGEELKLEL
jgi:S-adenosyl-L-methionine hydrolase (adenosine-forming)